MRIRKVSETTPITGNVINGYSESTTDGYSANYINELNTYSTEEQRIGTWIDGKPVYRKTIVYTNSETIGATGTRIDVNIPHNIRNFGNIIKPPYVVSNTGNIFPILSSGNTPSNVESSASISFVNTANIQMRLINLTLSSRTFYLTLEYTKTTD